jgi:hypothetical protein
MPMKLKGPLVSAMIVSGPPLPAKTPLPSPRAARNATDPESLIEGRASGKKVPLAVPL